MFLCFINQRLILILKKLILNSKSDLIELGCSITQLKKIYVKIFVNACKNVLKLFFLFLSKDCLQLDV